MRLTDLLETKLNIKHMALELQAKLLDAVDLDIELKQEESGVITLELMNDYYLTLNDDPELEDPITLAHRGQPVPMTVGYQDQRYGYQVIADFSTVDSAVEWITTWHEKITGLTESKDPGPIDKRVMLYFQTRALEYDTGPNFDVDTELHDGPHPKLMIRFPEHYEYDIEVTFMTNAGDSKPRIRAVIDDRNDDGGPIGKVTYVMLKMPDSVNIFVDAGVLSNGEDSVNCPTWEAAIDFFMREVDKRIKELWVEDPTFSRK